MPDTMMLPLMHRAAELSPSSFSTEDRTVDVVWSTGAVVRRTPWFGDPYDEELSMDPTHVHMERLNDRGAVLRDHDHFSVDSVIGTVVPGTARIENGRAVASIQFSEREDVAAIVGDVQAGILRSVSVGYSVQKYAVTERDDGPSHYLAIEWTPMEISVVPIGADPGAGFRSAESATECAVVRSSDDHQEEREIDMPDTPAPVAEPEIAADAAVVETRNDPALTEQVDIDAHVQRALQAQRKRSAAITEIVTRAKLDRSVADDLILREVTVEQARSAVLDALCERADKTPTFPHVSFPIGGLDDKVTRREAAVTALMHRYDPGHNQMTDAAREFRSMSLIEVARDFLTANGEHVRGVDKSELVTRAMGSSDFPNVLSTVSNKSLRQGYQASPRTFTPFCRQVSAVDFKPVNRVQLSGASQLQLVNEHGEYKRGRLYESNEAYSLLTYGEVVPITRKVIINDDLDAFTRVPSIMGTAAANKESDIVWAIFTANAALSDNIALFHANHANLMSTAAISSTSVAEGYKLMALQKDLDATTVLNLMPRYLIAPVGKIGVVQQLFGMVYAAQTSNVVPELVRGLTPILEPRLDTSAANTWYLAADPSQVDTIEYAYLEGQTGPYTEERMGFDVDGIEIKIRHDFAAKAIDFRGLAKNVGA